MSLFEWSTVTLPANIRQGQKMMAVKNPLAYSAAV
jgi:hypothetical protein